MPAPDYSRKWLVLSAVGMGIFLSTIDGSIVNVAVPTLERDLGATFALVQWVVLGYLLTLSSLLLTVGRLADMRGKKNIYLSGFVLFTLASALCGLAPNIVWLIVFRVLQAIGGAMVAALGSAIITEAFPASERGRALSYGSVIVSLGIMAGPTLGGLLIQYFSWRSIFYVNLPVGVIGVALVYRFVPWSPPRPGQRFDAPGALLLFGALLSLLLALSFSQGAGWRSPLVIGLLVGSGLLAISFVLASLRTPQPMVDLHLFRNVLFSVNLVTGVLVFIAMAGSTFLMPFYLNNVLGYPMQQVGLLLAVVPVGLGLMGPLAGLLSDRFGTRAICVAGLLLLTVGFVLISTLSTDTTRSGYILRYALVGLGIGLFNAPNNSAIMGAAPRERLGIASGLIALARVLGQTAGVATLGALWASRVQAATSIPVGADVTSAPPSALVAGLHDAFLLGAAVVGLALLLALAALRLENRQRRA